MKLTVLGSGSGILRKERVSSGFLLQTKRSNILLDCGNGVIRQLLKIGFDYGNIDHVVISHPHCDHMSDLLPLLQSTFVRGIEYIGPAREKPLYLHGYPRFKKDYNQLRRIMFPERVEQYQIQIEEHRNGRKKYGSFTLETRIVPHVPKYFDAIGVRIEAEGKTICYSGDTGMGQPVVELARNADLAIFESAYPLKMHRKTGPVRNHLSAIDAAKMAEEAGVKTLLLSHQYDLDQLRETRKAAENNFSGKVIIARDLLKLKI